MLLLFTPSQRHEISQYIFYSKGSGIPWDQVPSNHHSSLSRSVSISSAASPTPPNAKRPASSTSLPTGAFRSRVPPIPRTESITPSPTSPPSSSPNRFHVSTFPPTTSPSRSLPRSATPTAMKRPRTEFRGVGRRARSRLRGCRRAFDDHRGSIPIEFGPSMIPMVGRFPRENHGNRVVFGKPAGRSEFVRADGGGAAGPIFGEGRNRDIGSQMVPTCSQSGQSVSAVFAAFLPGNRDRNSLGLGEHASLPNPG